MYFFLVLTKLFNSKKKPLVVYNKQFGCFKRYSAEPTLKYLVLSCHFVYYVIDAMDGHFEFETLILNLSHFILTFVDLFTYVIKNPCAFKHHS